MVHARNQGVSRLIVHALSENAAMLRIARKAGAEVVREGSESEACLELPPADFGSQVGELLAEGLARTDYRLKAGVKQVRGVIDLMHEIRKACATRATRPSPDPVALLSRACRYPRCFATTPTYSGRSPSQSGTAAWRAA